MKNQLVWALSLFVLCMISCKPAEPKEEAVVVKKDTVMVTPPAELLDMKYAETVKSGMAALSRGDVAAYMTQFADNAVYNWNTGDSLAGKAAINDYWVKRRGTMIESLQFSEEIYLPVKVNKPQTASEKPGIWVLSWYKVDAKYKTTGKSMTQFMHSVSHFDANNKIDQVVLYSDRASINAAMTK